MAAVMNERCFVEPPYIETVDGRTWTVVSKAYHWNGHPRFGFSTHRKDCDSLPEALAYLARLGFSLAEPVPTPDPEPTQMEVSHG